MSYLIEVFNIYVLKKMLLNFYTPKILSIKLQSITKTKQQL